jgi:hypothetical protein
MYKVDFIYFINSSYLCNVNRLLMSCKFSTGSYPEPVRSTPNRQTLNSLSQGVRKLINFDMPRRTFKDQSDTKKKKKKFLDTLCFK